MDRYRDNAKWLTCLSPFRQLSISAAYLTPFFLQRGLSLTQIFLLQGIFSVAFLLWEIPSGIIADKFGRAFSIKLSGPISAVAVIAYGFSNHFWQFAVWELVLALGNGLISGIDTALLIDSLKAEGRDDQFRALSQRIQVAGYLGVAVGVPVAILLVTFVSVRSTLIADGILTAIGQVFAFKLVEAPRFGSGEQDLRKASMQAIRKLGRNVEARWLVVLGSVLSAATYLAFWLSAPYYTSMGVPVAWFSVILAVRSVWKAWLSHKFVSTSHLGRNMVTYALLAPAVYLGMATGQLWLIWVVFGHDVVQALQSMPITDRLNRHIPHEFRATLNSAANLVQRLVYSLAGPLVGLIADHDGLSVAFVACGTVCGMVSMIAIARLYVLGTFREKS